MKNPVFTGAGVAIITPMYEDGSINFDELGRIIEDQIARSTDAIVICGTTGECSTMTDEEQLAAIKYTVDVVNHRVPVIAGAGSNDTDHGCALAAKSAACGADALLMVTPYYNKTSQAGLVAHFTAMAEAGGIPVIVYNVPSRTGLNIAPETALELSKHPLINGIKEASGNISQVAKIAQLCGDELNIYSGNDDQVVPLLSLGGKGVISVLSNVAPQYTHDICAKWFAGDFDESLAMQLKALPLIKALFADVNPIPVKWAMNRLGWQAGECRLPLVAPSAAVQAQLENAMQDFGLRRILYRHLKYDSPYNTYVNEGLPPSPICMPGKNAIDAVLNYEKHDYIFFCARPEFDGYHNFAKTLREHNKNARAYSDELNRRKIK